MHSIVKVAVVANVILVLVFVFSNYVVWDYVQSTSYLVQLVSFSPFSIFVVPLGALENGKIIAIQLVKDAMPNFPFWLFFVAVAVNLYFIFKLSKKNNKLKHNRHLSI